MRILITGATGFIGSDLTKRWLDNEHEIIALVRDTAQAEKMLGPNVSLITELNAIHSGTQLDAIVNLAGAPIADRLWTKKYRRTLLESRVDTTRNLVSLVENLEKKPEVMISASAAGYYGRRGTEPLSELEPSQDIFMSQLCYAWEKAAEAVEKHGVRLVIPRISVVLGRGGGALPKLMRPAKIGAATVIGPGGFYFPWIHKSDLLEMFGYFLENQSIRGPVNAIAPHTNTQRSFQKHLAKSVNRPCFLWAPATVFKLMLGEMSDLFVSGQNMSAEKILSAGFEFKYPDIDAALTDLMR